MWQEFFASWELFRGPYVTGLLAALVLGFLGVLLLARDQAFLGVTMGNGAALGVALAAWLPFGGAASASGRTGQLVCAVLVAAIVAAFALTTRRGRPPSTTRLAVLFAMCGAGAVLFASGSPRGIHDVQRVLTGSLLWATDVHFLAEVALTLLVLPLGYALRARLLSCVLDRDTAQVAGLRPGVVLPALTIALATAIGVSTHAAGLLFTFGMLVLPATAARPFCRSATALLILAPVFAFVATATALVLGFSWDIPPGPLAVALVALPALWST